MTGYGYIYHKGHSTTFHFTTGLPSFPRLVLSSVVIDLIFDFHTLYRRCGKFVHLWLCEVALREMHTFLSDPASLMNFSHIQFILNWTPRNCHSVLFDLEVLDDKRDCHLSRRRRLFHLKADFIGLCLLSCRSSPAFGNGAHKFRPGPPLPLTQRLWYLPTSITKLSLH